MEAKIQQTTAAGQFRLFSVLWAVAALFHMAYANVFSVKLNYALLTLAAIYVIYNPGSVKGFIIMLALQLYDVFYLMPRVNNHWLFTAFVNLTILQALFYLIFRRKSFEIDSGKWFESFAPVVRMEVLILYFFAVFHKLNSAFLNPDVSCATDLLKSQNIPFIPLTPLVFLYSGYFTLFIETLIPLLLLFKRTRRAGILTGILFHSVLAYSSYNGYFDFSSMMFALYFLFTGPQFTTDFFKSWNAVKKAQFIKKFSAQRVAVLIFIALSGFLVLHFLVNRLPVFQDFNLYIFWLGYNLLFLYFIGRYCFRKPEDETFISFSVIRPSFWLIPVLVFLNGCSPYLGLKTENSFSMFSNLRTEGGVTNHYLIPPGMQLFDFQKKYVRIITSTDPHLEEIAKTNKMMVLFHFSDYIHLKKPERVEYILDGKLENFSLNGESSRVVEKPPYLLKKTFSFRLFTSDPQKCGH